MRHTERILKYLDGKLNNDELHKFERELQTDPTLKEELELHQLVDSSISRQNELRFRKKLRETELEYLRRHRKEKQKKDKRKQLFSGFRNPYLFAALAAAVFAFVFLLKNLHSNPEKLYNSYYSKFAQDLSSRSSLENSADALSSGVEHYLKSEYDEAVADLTLYAGINSKDIVAYFYRGLSLLEEGKYDLARKDFLKVINQDYNYYMEHSKWYYSLCCLKLGDTENAENSFFS